MPVSLEDFALVEELPAIPDGWRYESLGNLVEERGICYGIVQPGSQTSDGVPIIRVNNIRNGRIDTSDVMRVEADIESKFQRSRLRGGEVLLTLVGTLGEVAIVPDELRDWNVARAVGVIPVRKDPGTLWVSICLRSSFIQHCIRIWATTTVQATFNLRDLAKLPIPIPPKETREAIARILGTLDDKIELNRRMNATLEAMARALFRSWFVDFDPVRAKLDGRQLPNLDPATAALFPDSFRDSELGHVPEGWDVCPLSKKIELLSGGTPKTSEPSYWDGSIPWYSVKDAPSETEVWVIQTEKHITEKGVANSATQVLPEGTTIISARGTVGKLALIGTPMAMNQSCYGVRGIAGYGECFTYFVLREAVGDLQQRTHGTVFDTITRQTFDTLDRIFPPADLTAAFDRAVAPLLVQIRSNLRQSRTLANLRDTLLPKFLSGELRVPQIRPALENVFPFPEEAATKPPRKATDEFIEAIVIAQLTRKLGTAQYPLGRMRYNKLAYLAHRKAEDDVSQHYLKKAAGPYSPWAKYSGPEKIAKTNGYVEQTKNGVFEGLVAGPNIGKIDQYLSHYPVCGAVDWIIDKFQYRKKDELELLATVDFAALDLIRAGKTISLNAIKQVIATNKDWAPKLDRAVFSDVNIQRSLTELAGLFPATYT